VRERSRAYLQALLDRVERKNGWQLAEAMGEADPNGAQRLLYAAVWDADAVRDELQRFVSEAFGQADGILVVDESGVPKKGPKSVGVAKQYCGALGKVEQCQVGVSLTYASAQGHAFLDRRLFLPEEWTKDAARCQEAKVPESVTFASKAQLAQAMLEHAFALGIPAAWVAGDEGYGSAPALRTSLERRPCAYVLAVRSNEPLTVPPRTPKPRLVGLLETARPLRVSAPRPSSNRQRGSATARERGAKENGGTTGHGCPWPRRRRPGGASGCWYGAAWTTANWPTIASSRGKARHWRRRSTWPGRAGPSSSAWRKRKARQDSISTKSATGPVGTARSRCRSWPTPSWPGCACAPGTTTSPSAAGGKISASTSTPVADRTALVPVSVPEARRLLALALPWPPRPRQRRLNWSLWRRRHQARAKDCHYRRRQRRSLPSTLPP